MSLKQKTINSLFWSFIEVFAVQGLQFIVGVVLARILTPKDFGLVGMLTVFIAISQTIIDSGFSQALIRKQDCNQKDFSTIFYFNLGIATVLYLILFLCSGLISNFFNEPKLTLLLKVLGLALILNSFSIIQKTILTKYFDFKTQTKVSIVAGIISGTISVVLAYKGYGVWSLVVFTLSRFGLSSLLLWVWSKWRPALVFSMQSLKELFAFGSKLLASGIIDTVYRNIYYLVIGKFFTASDLGYYSRADQFKTISSRNLQMIIGRVSYPALSSIQDDDIRLKSAYKRLIKSTMLISFLLMLSISSTARSLIYTLIGPKWEPAVIYLQLLCIAGMFYPLHALNLNILKVKNRTDIFLKLEVIKKVISIPVIFVGIFFGIETMIVGMIFNSIIAYYLNSYYSGRLINYGFWEQVRDILPIFILAVFIAGTTHLLEYVTDVKPLILLLIQGFTIMILTLGLCEITKLESYRYIKNIIFEKIRDYGQKRRK